MTNYRLYLKNIFEAMDAAQAFVSGMDFAAFVSDDKPLLPFCKNLKLSGKQLRRFQKRFNKTIRRSLGSR